MDPMTSAPLPPATGFRSLTTRFIVWTLVSVGAVYVATVVVSNGLARRQAIAAAEREAVNVTEAAVGHVDDVLHSIEERTLALGDAVSVVRPDEGEADQLLLRFVLGNHDLHGGAIAWAPGTRGEHQALYYHRIGDGPGHLEPLDLTSEAHRYWDRGWFREAIASRKPLWTEPYEEAGPGEGWRVTYGVPFGPPGGAPAGVVAADVLLERLDSIVEQIHLGRRGFGLVVSRSGHIVAQSRLERVDHAVTLLEQARPDARVWLEPISRKVAAGEPGFVRVERGGQPFRLTYRPVRRAGWTLATLYPEDELLAGVARLRVVQASLGAGGLALLTLVVVVLSRRLTRPISALAASADAIARGDLDAPLPPVESRDEVGALARAFHHMRDSLKEYIRNLKETTAAKERLEGELRVARRIQADMLPEPTAGGPGEGYEIGATLVPARQVGGDLFDHFRDGSRVFFLVGDVSGKGVAAALFMARAKAVFEAVAARETDHPGAVLDAVNRSLCRENEAGMFVTAAAGVLHLESGELAFALAGHDAPVLVPASGPPRPLRAEGGPVLGLIEASAFPVNRLTLCGGDAIVLYTDGVSEAQDAAGGFFGVERILATASSLRDAAAPALTYGLLEAVRAFAGEAPQWDDITILTLRRLAPAA
jgi:sigma-B regulation protein RsbU (phosphoserine phosphatase)